MTRGPSLFCALLDANLEARCARLAARGAHAWRAAITRSEAGRGEDAGDRAASGDDRLIIFIIELPAADARRLRDDPVLGAAMVLEEVGGASAVEPGRVLRLAGRRGRILEVRVLAPFPGGRKGLEPRDAMVLERLPSSRIGIRLHGTRPPRRRRTDGNLAGALWIPGGAAHRFIEMLAGEPPWGGLVRLHAARGGLVARGDDLPGRRELARNGLALAVPLCVRGGPESGVLHVEPRAASPLVLDGLEPLGGHAVIRIEEGRVAAERIGPELGLGDLLRHASARVAFLPSTRGTPEGSPPGGPDLRSPASAAELCARLEPARDRDPELGSALEDAFGAPRPEAPARKDEGSAAGRWLRRFIPRRLGEAARRQLDLRSRRRIADPLERSRVIARQRDAIALLLARLSGKAWREALPLALPLRAPGEVEADSTWLHSGEPGRESDIEFDLDRAARKSAHGVIGVGERIHGELQTLYRRAGEALLSSGAHRQAAHVFSYLLGDHARAAAVLEQGGFTRDAATVYYHLARLERKAAVALDRGELHEEAARIWMDLGKWPEAARAWSRAGDRVQADAAWRRVQGDLQKEGRLHEAAAVLERELGDRAGARNVRMLCAVRGDPASLDALERCVRSWAEDGEEDRAAEVMAIARREYELQASRFPGRVSILRLADLAARAAGWAVDDPARRAAGEDAARSLWVVAAGSWARVRRAAPPALRREVDEGILRAGRAQTDPWLERDAAEWLRGLTPEGSAGVAGGLAIEDIWLGTRASSLHVGPLGAFAGLEDGRIAALHPGGGGIEYLDTGSARPITALASSRADLYSASDEETHHFADLSPGGRAPHGGRPMQVERTLRGRVQSLVLFPEAGLLRVTARETRLLHHAHLAPLRVPHHELEGSIAASCGNPRLAALLVSLGREEGEVPWSAGARFEVHVLQKRGARAVMELRHVETFQAGGGDWRRIAFLGPEGDEIVLSGEEDLAVFPSRRDRPDRGGLEISSAGGRLPPARVEATPGRESLLVAHGEGSLERIVLDGSARGFLVHGPEELDPLVGFACEGKRAGAAGAAPWTAWLLHRSGRLRRVPAERRTDSGSPEAGDPRG